MRMLRVSLIPGAFIAVAGLEILLHALPVSTSTRLGYYIHPDILTYPPGHHWTTSTGWDLKNAQRHRSNNLGFLADADFVPDPNAVALIGDSYVEASMLDPADRPGARLQEGLPGRPVYAMGGPGSSLLDYAQRIDHAYHRLGVRSVVVLAEHTDASQAICGSGNVHAHCLDASSLQPRQVRQASPNLTKRLLRESALAQYMTSQLKLTPQRLMRRDFWSPGTQHPPASSAPPAAPLWAPPSLQPDRRQAIDAVVEQFAARVRALEGLELLLVVDMNRALLAEDPIGQTDESQYLAERLRSQGLRVMQAEPQYRRHYQTSSLSLDVGPYDGHLNAHGVALLMSAVVRELNTGFESQKGIK